MKAVFITGATSGIGLELAKLYLAQGWKVGVCGRSKEKFTQEFSAYRDNASFYQVDVNDRAAIKQAIREFASPIGLHLVIASAGIASQNKTKIPDFEYGIKMVNTNVLGVMHTFEAALDVMIPQGQGQLVGISSVAGWNGLPGVSSYSASKAAVSAYCETLQLDLKKFNIHVTCVCPGFVDTPLTRVNHHPMPFLVTAPVAAKKIYKAVAAKRFNYAFPLPMFLVVRLLSIMPRWVYRFLMGIKAFNYSKD